MDFNDSFARRVSLVRCCIYIWCEHGVSFLFIFRIFLSKEDVNVVDVVRNFTEVFIYFISFMILFFINR